MSLLLRRLFNKKVMFIIEIISKPINDNMVVNL